MTVLTEVKRLIDSTNVSHLARISKVSRSQLARIADGLTTDPGIETVALVLNALGYDLEIVRRPVCQPDDVKPARKDLED